MACGLNAGHAQKQAIDEVVAIVGDEAIMRSDIEGQYLQMPGSNLDREKAHCLILNQLMEKKMFLLRAQADSLKINDDQVESELSRRIQFFIQRYGSEENMKEQLGKSALELKNDFRQAIRDQLLEQQMQEKIVSNTDVTPSDVRKFYKGLPTDSLPYYDTEMEIGQIVLYPKVTRQEKQEAMDKLTQIRKDILSGAATFESKAIRYSEDPGSFTKGGDLEMQRSDQFVPEFASAALKLKKDSISEIIETKFGFHIIQMLERRGDMIHVRHILIRPKVSEEDRIATRKELDSIRSRIISDSITFDDAAYKFSKDEETKNRGGLMIDMKTNSSHIPVKELDGALFFSVDKMKVGELSKPESYTTPDNKEAFRILYLKSKIPPHKANLKDDYPKIMQIAKEYKKLDMIQQWLKKYIPYTYIRIDKSYQNCDDLKIWIKPVQN